MVQMSESAEQVQTAGRLWEEHRREPFPDSLRNATFEGTHVWLLELDIAGCVIRWLESGGTLDVQNSRSVQSRIEDLDRIIPEINDPKGAQYCQQLRQLAVLVSKNPSSTT